METLLAILIVENVAGFVFKALLCHVARAQEHNGTKIGRPS